MSRTSVFLLGALLFSAISTAAQISTDEVPVSAPIYGAAAYEQSPPLVASDGRDYLGVWPEQRCCLPNPTREYFDLHVARFSATGERRDITSLFVPLHTNRTFTALVYGGGRYLLSSADMTGVYGRWVSPEGVVSEEFLIYATGVGPAGGIPPPYPRVAWNGREFLVAWRVGNSSNHPNTFLGALVAPDGYVLKSDLVITNSGGFEFDVSNDGTGFLFVTTVGPLFSNQLLVVPIGADARTQSPFRVDVESVYGMLRLTYDRISYVAVWKSGSGSTSSVKARRIDSGRTSSSWTIFQGDGFIADIASGNDGAVALIGAPLQQDGGARHLFAVRVEDARTQLLTETFTIGAAVAANGSNYLVAWRDMRNVPKLGTPPGAGVDLWGNIVSFSAPGDLFSAFEFARSATHQESPSITPVGSDFFITWQEFVPSEKKSIVFGSRLLPTGELPDGRGIRIADSDAHQLTPRVASNGNVVLLVWRETDPDSIRARLMTITGLPLGDPMLISNDDIHYQFPPDVAWDGSEFVVAWTAGHLSGYIDAARIQASRITASGLLLDPGGTTISTGTSNRGAAIASAGNSQALVAWAKNGVGLYRKSESALDVVLVENGIPKNRFELPTYCIQATATWAGSHYVVAWRGSDSLAWVVVGPTGDAISKPQVLPMSATMYDGSVALTSRGSTTVLAWDETSQTGNVDLYALTLNEDGLVGEPRRIISRAQDRQRQPRLVSANEGILLTYTRRANESAYGGVDRVFLKLLPSVPRRRTSAQP